MLKAHSLSIPLFFVLSFFLFQPLVAQLGAEAEASMDYYLPASVRYNPNIPTPKQVLDMEVGEWHVRHDQLVQYMYAVAEASDRVSIMEYGRTHENRKLLSLVITSPENHARIEELREQHLLLTDAAQSGELDTSTMPVVVALSYSVHGNEPSTANAALLAVYHFAAGEGPEIEDALENSILLVDPAINPDGLNRFAHWVNSHKSKKVLVSDPQSREYRETWPGGRTNHYWFDLNRDWLLVQHPESQGRIARFHEWKPNVQTDHHEMGSNSTFFFQPGIPSRTHPLTPQRNQDITGAIAEYHADAFDEVQSLYYSKESFDDYYYGKGSTFPDINGAIGILFEQASSRGHGQQTVHGLMKFPFTIKNQFISTLSTVKASLELREELLNHQRLFYQEAAARARNSSIKAYIFGEEADQARTQHLAELITRHGINVFALKEDFGTFKQGKAFVVPADQRDHMLLTAMFERRTEFTDSLFYDVSAWTMPYAFNLPFEELSNRQFNRDMLGERYELGQRLPGQLVGGTSAYSYVFEWDEYYAPRALYRLLSAGVRAKVASQPFTAVTATGAVEFDYGTILVPLGIQNDQDQVHEIVKSITEEDGISVYNIKTGLTPSGMDLGSNNFENLREPKVAIVGGDGTSSYEVGEVWHLLDQRYHMPLSIIPTDRFRSADLDRYNVIVMASGWGYNSLPKSTVDNLKRWVREGGTLVTYKSAINWVKNQGLGRFETVGSSSDDDEEVKQRPYAKVSRDNGARVIGGAIFNATLDLTHPMAYGFNSEKLTVFRNSTLMMQKGDNPYSSPVVYTDQPLASGYISDENLERLKGSAAVIVSRTGSGKVIMMTDNPNFRGFWYGTNKLFANAVFFGHTISNSTTN